MKHLKKEQIEQIKELRKEIGALNNKQMMINNKISKLMSNIIDNISEMSEEDIQKLPKNSLTLQVFENCIYNELDSTDLTIYHNIIEIAQRLQAIDGLLMNIEARSK